MKVEWIANEMFSSRRRGESNFRHVFRIRFGYDFLQSTTSEDTYVQCTYIRSCRNRVFQNLKNGRKSKRGSEFELRIFIGFSELTHIREDRLNLDFGIFFFKTSRLETGKSRTRPYRTRVLVQFEGSPFD